MKTDVLENEKLKINDEVLLEYIKSKSLFAKILYVDLGVKIVRLICYNEQFIPHIEKQLTYTMRENASKYDATVILWLQEEIDKISEVKGLFVSSENNDEKGWW